MRLHRTRRGRAAGYTLLELVVSVAVFTPVLLIATALLRESQLIYARHGVAVRDPAPQLALAMVRHDLYAARDVTAGSFVWSDEPLAIVRADGRRVVYRRRADRFERLELDAAGEPLSRRVLLAGVEAWRWRVASARLVDLELAYRRSADLTSARGGRVAAPAVGAVRSARLRFALRGGRGGQRW